MSRIRSRNTKLEVSFLKLLSALSYPAGLRYRKHYRKLPGNPDAAFVKQKLAIFIDGDFWHGYNLKKLGKKVPRKYWLAKINRNIKRDKEVNRKLKKAGWEVLRFWEHDIKKNTQKAVQKIISVLKH
jgi:DNA mismatch endonuclease (patch repair protein)